MEMNPLGINHRLLYCGCLESHLHVFIEQHHQEEAEDGAGGHHADQEGREEFVGNDSFCEVTK